MTLDELKLRHSALLGARYSGTRSVSCVFRGMVGTDFI